MLNPHRVARNEFSATLVFPEFHTFCVTSNQSRCKYLNLLLQTRQLDRFGLTALDPIHSPIFPSYFGASARRISNLICFHCGATQDVDFKGLMRRTTESNAVSYKQRRYDWKCKSDQRQCHRHLDGFMAKSHIGGLSSQSYSCFDKISFIRGPISANSIGKVSQQSRP